MAHSLLLLLLLMMMMLSPAWYAVYF